MNGMWEYLKVAIPLALLFPAVLGTYALLSYRDARRREGRPLLVRPPRPQTGRAVRSSYGRPPAAAGVVGTTP